MIDINEIEKTIIDLEARDTTFATIERLAWLYTVKDHYKKIDTFTTGELGEDEFMKACSNVPLEPLMAIISEHMNCIKLVYPKEYASIMAKIRDL